MAFMGPALQQNRCRLILLMGTSEHTHIPDTSGGPGAACPEQYCWTMTGC
jgi:hypothetical protein